MCAPIGASSSRREQVGMGCRRAGDAGKVFIHGLVPESEYELELRLGYGSGASIGVGTMLRLSVPPAGGSDGSGHNVVTGAPMLEDAFGGHDFTASKGTLSAVLTKHLSCKWEWLKAMDGAGQAAPSLVGNSGVEGGPSRGVAGATAGVAAAAAAAGEGSTVNSSVAGLGAVIWIGGALAIASVLVLGCLVSRLRRRRSNSHRVEGVNAT